YVPKPEYPKYLVPSNAEAPIEDQPLPDDASLAALSSGYVTDFDPEEDPEEDPEDDPSDYHADGGYHDDESSRDDDDDKDEEKASKEEDDDDEEEEEHLAPADSFAIHLIGQGYPSNPRHQCQLLLRHSLPRDDITKAYMPLRNRARYTAPAFGFEVRESLVCAAARQPGLDVATMDVIPRHLMSREIGYGIKDV
nr:hypothetical protein [Tanacetum cinerariifolium]